MLRMDSGSKCTWYKFVGGGGTKQSNIWVTLTGGETIRWTPGKHIIGNNIVTALRSCCSRLCDMALWLTGLLPFLGENSQTCGKTTT